MRTKYISMIFLASLMLICLSCKDEDDSLARSGLIECIQKAETSISESVEGNEEGCIAPGSKDIYKPVLIGPILSFRIHHRMKPIPMH